MPKPARPAEPDASAAAARRAGAAPLADLLARSRLKLEARIHLGRMTDVWRAVSRSGAAVAVKTPAAPWAAHLGARVWLEREHRALAGLAHPRILRVVDFLERDGCVALVTEYLGGGDLVPLAGAPAEHWLAAAAGVAEALVHVHARGYVHGDVKARNVLLAAGADAGTAKLADFGSALPVGAALPETFGTRAHRPPGSTSRNARAEDDVYAFAVLLYELMAGRLPFGAEPDLTEDACLAPLPAGGSSALAELGGLVLDVLAAPDRIAAGTLSKFFDVIELGRVEAARAR